VLQLSFVAVGKLVPPDPAKHKEQADNDDGEKWQVNPISENFYIVQCADKTGNCGEEKHVTK
jgi:hypothetical protein